MILRRAGVAAGFAMASVALLAVFFLTSRRAPSTPREPDFETLLAFCRAQTLAQAETIGDSLGWERLPVAAADDWKRGFRHMFPGAAIQWAGWRRPSEREPGLESGPGLGFRVVEGAGAHRACDFSAPRPGAWRADLERAFGAPADLTEAAGFVSFRQEKDGLEISFSQTPAGAIHIVIVTGP